MRLLGLGPLDQDDTSMLDLRTAVVVQEKAIEGIAQRLADHDSPRFRERCGELAKAADKALREGDEAEASRILRQLMGWTSKGRAEDSALESLSKMAARLQAQVAQAHRIRLSAENVVNREDLLRTLVGVVRLVRDVVGQREAAEVLARLDREVLGGSLGAGAPTLARGVEPDRPEPDGPVAD
ncbi:MAG: hypothetical protein AAFP86_07230 [Planctomycetota bacterium]